MIEQLPVFINGKRLIPRKLTMTKKKYVWISDEEVTCLLPMPLLLVEAESPVVFTIAEDSTNETAAQA